MGEFRHDIGWGTIDPATITAMKMSGELTGKTYLAFRFELYADSLCGLHGDGI
jgi:hypothetical protein